MKKPVQIGKSLMGDFEENTWTFEMDENFKLSAGRFAIVPLEKYNEFLKNKNHENKTHTIFYPDGKSHFGRTENPDQENHQTTT